jgi:hypothetical protein
MRFPGQRGLIEGQQSNRAAEPWRRLNPQAQTPGDVPLLLGLVKLAHFGV